MWRYYKVGLVNTAFGYGLYSALVYLGLNLFVAQIVTQIVGATFNFFMFKRHVFTTADVRLWRYVGSYTVNYFIGLALLFGFHHLFPSPYIAGLCSVIASSMINYVLLKLFVFRDRRGPP